MILRKANLDDIELLIQLRIDYLTEDTGILTQEESFAIKRQLKEYFLKAISNNSFIGILAEIEGAVVSAAFLVISERPANPAFITGITGTLLNVITYPEYRRKGIATKVIEKIIDESKKEGVSSIDLMATEDGKALYEKMGFTITKYTAMRVKLI